MFQPRHKNKDSKTRHLKTRDQIIIHRQDGRSAFKTVSLAENPEPLLPLTVKKNRTNIVVFLSRNVYLRHFIGLSVVWFDVLIRIICSSAHNGSKSTLTMTSTSTSTSTTTMTTTTTTASTRMIK